LQFLFNQSKDYLPSSSTAETNCMGHSDEELEKVHEEENHEVERAVIPAKKNNLLKHDLNLFPEYT